MAECSPAPINTHKIPAAKESSISRKDFPIVLIAPYSIDSGIGYISSFLKSKGFPTYIINFEHLRLPYSIIDNDYFINPVMRHQVCPEQDLKLLIKLIRQLNPRLIGVSVTSVTMRTAQMMTAEIKRHFDIPVVWGGVHAIIAPEECMQYVDIVCRGEGEYPMRELAEKLRSAQTLTNIPSLWIRRKNGDIEKNELRPLINDLDSLPMPDLIDTDNKFLIDNARVFRDAPIHSIGQVTCYPIITSRGCMYNCSFCSNAIIREQYKDKGPYLRRRSVENVIKELRSAIENRYINAIQFWDDVFTYDKEWIDEFVRLYIRDIGRIFFCYGHPRYTDKAIIRRLAEAGLVTLITGIQSGSERVNKDLMGRNQSNQQIIDFARMLQESFVLPCFDYIAENPYEADSDNDQAVELLLRLPRPYSILFYSLCYYPKTSLTKKALQDGIITEEDLEQHTSKSLNNFFMFLPLSKNKKEFFWNCIKAMAVNKYFSKGLVRFCKRNIFLKKRPKLLYCFAKGYVHLIHFILFKVLMIPRYRIQIVPELSPQFTPVEKYIWFSRRKDLTFSPIFEGLFLPLESNDGHKLFAFKITSRLRISMTVKFFVDIKPFRTRKMTERAIWEIKLKLNPLHRRDIYLDLAYPYLDASFDGAKTKARLVKDSIDEFGKHGLYFLRFKYEIPFLGIKKLVSQILFKI